MNTPRTISPDGSVMFIFNPLTLLSCDNTSPPTAIRITPSIQRILLKNMRGTLRYLGVFGRISDVLTMRTSFEDCALDGEGGGC